MRTDKQQAGVSKLTHPLVVMDYRDYWYWFTLLYCSTNVSKSLNNLILSSFIFPALITFLLAFNQLSKSCSSIRYFDGFRLLVSINVLISLYFANQRSSYFIEQTPQALKIFTDTNALILLTRAARLCRLFRNRLCCFACRRRSQEWYHISLSCTRRQN